VRRDLAVAVPKQSFSILYRGANSSKPMSERMLLMPSSA